MPKKTYAFEPGGQKRLDIEWKGLFNHMILTVDGVQVGEIPNQQALMAGKDFKLKDGSKLHVQMLSSLMGSEMQVLRNGKPLPDSATSTGSRIRNAAITIFIIAGLEFLDGLLALFVDSKYIKMLGTGWYALLYSVFFLGMGFWVRRKSRLALLLSAVVFLADTFISLWFGAQSSGETSMFGLLIRIFFVFPLIQALRAMSDDNKEAAQKEKNKS